MAEPVCLSPCAGDTPVSDAIGFFIIATGVDHADVAHQANVGVFSQYANRRVLDLIGKICDDVANNVYLQSPARARFLHFDFSKTIINCLNGATTPVINIYEHPIKATGTVRLSKHPGWVPYNQLQSDIGVGPGDPNDPATFVDATLADALTPDGTVTFKSLSITNVYHTVRKAPQNSVICLDIFSHGWFRARFL